MEGQFHVDRGTCASARDGYQAIPAHEANRPIQTWQFVSDFERLVGETSEPDPQFFVETWTLGMAAAVENFQQRRRRQEDGGRQMPAFGGRVFGDTGNFEPAQFQREGASGARFRSSASMGTTAEPQYEEEPTQEWDTYAGKYACGQETSHPMTEATAYRLLGVTATSTRVEIKAAYRQKVSQWHPDRLGRMSEEQRRAATERMAAINEAYRLLRN